MLETGSGRTSFPSWNQLGLSREELYLEGTLFSGQSFRWSEHDGEFVGVLRSHVYSLTYDAKHQVIFRCLETVQKAPLDPDGDITSHREVLLEFFNGDVDLQGLAAEWRHRDENFAAKLPRFCGLRTLRVEVLEAIISFICSSNNNIKRISLMVERLCALFAENRIPSVTLHAYYRFPTLPQLATVTEAALRSIGFGFRAPFVVQAVEKLLDLGGVPWALALRREEVSREEARQALQQLAGVGPKVADCICMCSLQKHDAVPVDTHCWQLIRRDYLEELRLAASLTAKRYEQIGTFFRQRFGPWAGWAFMHLFAAELTRFKPERTQAHASPAPSAPRKRQLCGRLKSDTLPVRSIYFSADTTESEPNGSPPVT
ncbi:8-oxoguanine glycosylase ogg1 [Cymbomonas tetramitiformis]|uniref:DNA-(apurinic or apyrimidinic site) lyase n=1 Tax=Cymbomonas tetramitiformis TaxID=36881 RepID=A0AAE0BKE8_9CHLO|nr:8-oxoguanine glycosylase ogg1 [Cymbomonas tetramitiformis]